MRISSKEWKGYGEALSAELVGQRLSKIVHYDSAAFLFSTSKSGTLVISLSGEQPRVYLSQFPVSIASNTSSLATALRKHASGAKVESIKTLNEDSILEILLAGTDEIFQPTTYYLIAELIPFKGNLILLDEERKVVASLYSGSLDSARPLFRGLEYTFPEKPDAPELKRDLIPYEEIVKSWKKEESAMEDRRKKAHYSTLFAKAKKNVKTLQNRLKAIDNDIISASAHVGDGEYGNYIYTCLEDIDPRTGYFDYYGERIALDPTLSAIKNAEAFFKRAKKAKAGIAMAKQRKEKTEEELDQAKAFLQLLELSSEEDLSRYEKELGGLEGKGSNAHYMGSTSFYPFECFVNGTRYVYGRNARQNEFLGTLFAKKGELLWLHVKLGHGSHLVIDKPSPSNKEIEKGCEICLLASGTTSGEVMIAEKKDVRKGNVIGLAIVKKYTSAMIKDISKEAKEAFANGRRVSP